MTASIFWYDLETTGINTRADRAVQIAGIRTDENLEFVGEPLNLYCRLSDDILPHPLASLVTGITHEQVQKGLPEHEFVAQLHAELAQPGTCSAGYNSIRFDDEMTRHALYRNFYDPYAREWQAGNSRWDLLDVLRTAWALRPEGIINWPVNEQGKTTFRLDLLTEANGIEHSMAHDALADVRATIAMARLLKQGWPKLYQYLYKMRGKRAVQRELVINQPAVHISGKFAVQRNCLAVILPLAMHPTNGNAYIVCDLQGDIRPLFELDAEMLRQRLYTPHSELQPDEGPIPLKLVHANKCPVVLPVNILRPQDIERLGIDEAHWRNNMQLLQQAPQLQRKLIEVFGAQEFPVPDDPEQQLYQGFLRDRDQGLSQILRQSSAQQLATQSWPFDDERLPELLFRYRARNYPDSLSQAEQSRWYEFCRGRLSGQMAGAPLTIQAYQAAFAQLDEAQQNMPLMQGWLRHVNALQQRYAL